MTAALARSPARSGPACLALGNPGGQAARSEPRPLGSAVRGNRLQLPSSAVSPRAPAETRADGRAKVEAPPRGEQRVPRSPRGARARRAEALRGGSRETKRCSPVGQMKPPKGTGPAAQNEPRVSPELLIPSLVCETEKPRATAGALRAPPHSHLFPIRPVCVVRS